MFQFSVFHRWCDTHTAAAEEKGEADWLLHHDYYVIIIFTIVITTAIITSIIQTITDIIMDCIVLLSLSYHRFYKYQITYNNLYCYLYHCHKCYHYYCWNSENASEFFFIMHILIRIIIIKNSCAIMALYLLSLKTIVSYSDISILSIPIKAIIVMSNYQLSFILFFSITFAWPCGNIIVSHL